MSLDKKNLSNLVDKADSVLNHLISFLKSNELDQNQILAWDIAWIKSLLVSAKHVIEYSFQKGNETDQKLSSFFLGDVFQDISTRIVPHLSKVGLTHEQLSSSIWSPEVMSHIQTVLAPAFYEPLAQTLLQKGSGGSYGLTEDQNLIRETFKKFAEDLVWPLAEKVHRHDLLVPQEIMNGLKEMGCFGLSIPVRYGGFQDDQKDDNMGMIIVTEELSRGSLGFAGSLITRPEILSKALLKGGTEEQKQKFLPVLATGEKMCAVAVTEPDYGSDVASMKVAATKVDGGWKLNGVKTWCTFAGFAHLVLVLARTDPDPKKGHKGLSILIAEKPSTDGHSFSHTQPQGGKIEGKSIGTIGYRGMHSYEVSFQDYFVPDENLIGGNAGLGKGFYLQMAGFAGGRLQTAARANGVMQAAFEKAISYSNERHVFGKPIANYQITRFKIARMAAIIHATRQLTYHAARLMDQNQGIMEASLIKFYSSKVAEWVTREAMQLHGGMGYAEEYAVSRFYVDARVFSIFEGAEDVLALRVIAKSLIEESVKK
ncbi:MAG: acyl-CoA dehydrogenase [Deltaproteobacteria bacterium RIFCSPLOWO2_12_FULL_40_28]|nr:MAG: acyl-CoA dehydrogenase [Deltaproteobacteria bacterium RIFCSPHIGHO2_02_FULL_40_28]OGQ19318.1 MAG: acyl-CoA dehydrogenase [Deltaproteobacteria bacterium RIFCSPHIGHO2_12_FULL_40_32]OGQ40458.1 MAG: acyl-CoA dehydrogenase [Deltaproteobacteria bacterium RIFCSPLOWO2_02_FULL_40_36]OGQ53694.1 MAG: acyl-CoA dehydrogenase [Deltaproteobacteria bacterium RIFCSPLOWO2_12_FULL_40_28]